MSPLGNRGNSKAAISSIADAEKAISEGGPPAASSVQVPRSAAFYERYARPVLDRNRLFVVAVIEGFAIIALALALVGLTPLKTVVPYLVQVHNNGSVEVSDALKSGPWTPSKASLTYWIGKWSRELLTIDGPRTRPQLQEAYGIVRGNAISQFMTYLNQHKPVSQAAEDPNLSQTVKINNLTFVSPDIALVHLETITVNTNKRINHNNFWLLTIIYGIVPPQTRSELYNNPLGIYVTNFTLQSSDGN